MYKEIYDFLKGMRDEASDIIGRQNVDDVPLFRSKDGKTPLKARNVKYYWDIACVKAGCIETYDEDNNKSKYVFHDLRAGAVKYLRL